MVKKEELNNLDHKKKAQRSDNDKVEWNLIQKRRWRKKEIREKVGKEKKSKRQHSSRNLLSSCLAYAHSSVCNDSSPATTNGYNYLSSILHLNEAELVHWWYLLQEGIKILAGMAQKVWTPSLVQDKGLLS